MAGDTPTPALVQAGANDRDAPQAINLDVSGTVGPDYLGQESVTVDGHPNDRPGVRSRIPERCGMDDPRVSRMDTGESLPVLLSSDMQADPTEGVQGSYTVIREGTCARCGYDRLRETAHTLAGERRATCNACGAIQEPRNERGYRLPKTEQERADERRDAGPTIGTVASREVVDLEPDTGFGPMVSLVGDRSVWSLYKSDAADLFWALVENGDIDLVSELRAHLDPIEQASVTVDLCPEGLSVTPSDTAED